MQQINLYLPEFRPNREPLRAIHMLWGLGAFLIFLIALVFFSMSNNKKLMAQLEQDRLELGKLNTQLSQMKQQRPQNDLDVLDQKILNLTQELARRNQIFGVVANKNLGNNVGFSEHLKALGRQSLDTVSLRVFSLYKGGNYLEFAGTTNSADQIPLYLQRLRSEPVYAEVGFGVFNIAPAKTGNVFDFSLAEVDTKTQTADTPITAVQRLLELNQQAQGNN